MKLHLLDRSSLKNRSFSVRKNQYPYFLKTWHYHPELELVAILKSTGTRFIGDSIQKFEKGEVVLIGNDLPHMWLNDEVYFNASSTCTAEAIAIHFKKKFLGDGFFEIPEMKHISNLFYEAKRGILFEGVKKSVILEINKLLQIKGFERTLKLIEILNLLAKHKQKKLLSSEGYINSFYKAENKNLIRAYEFIFGNFQKQIYLKDVAEIANMNPSAFSRFFKKVNRKTFIEYLNEVRIGYACKLLIENKYNVSGICYESGFNNISNFNRQFKKNTKYSPSEYIKLHKN